MREWWQDVLINTAGGAIGTLIAVGVVALAGRAAGLFDAARTFDPQQFLRWFSRIIFAIGASALAPLVIDWLA